LKPRVCCDRLDMLLADAGEKLFSVIANGTGPRRGFFLQARPLDRDVVLPSRATDAVEPSLRRGDGRPASIAVVMELHLSFCPSCGRDLAAWVRAHAVEFDALAREGAPHIMKTPGAG